jgi:hypothetical protein
MFTVATLLNEEDQGVITEISIVVLHATAIHFSIIVFQFISGLMFASVISAQAALCVSVVYTSFDQASQYVFSAILNQISFDTSQRFHVSSFGITKR